MADPADIAQEFFRSIERGDVDAALGLLAEDVDFRAPGSAMRGRDEVRPFLQGYVDGFPDARFAIDNVLTSGSLTAIEGTYAGTNSGPMATPQGEMPATGKPVAIPFVTVFDLDGDQIKSQRTYFDQMGFMAQLGLTEG